MKKTKWIEAVVDLVGEGVSIEVAERDGSTNGERKGKIATRISITEKRSESGCRAFEIPRSTRASRSKTRFRMPRDKL